MCGPGRRASCGGLARLCVRVYPGSARCPAPAPLTLGAPQSYALVFVLIGGWIAFRFIGPALGLYTLKAGITDIPL